MISTNQQTAANKNRLLAIQLVRRHGMLSRRQLAKLTGLRESTLSNIVRQLLQSGMFRPAGKAKSDAAGQRQVMVEMNPLRGWAIGVTLDYGHANAVLLDAAGQLIDKFSFPITNDLTQLPQRLDRRLTQWIVKHQRPAGTLLGIGVGVPGIVDHQQGRILLASRFDARDVPLADLMRQQFKDTAIVIDHNTHLAAMAEVWCGVAKELENFLYFMISAKKTTKGHQLNSYGLTVYLGGDVHRGGSFAAGELDRVLRPTIKRTLTKNDMRCLASTEAALTPAVKQILTSLSQALGPLINLLDPEAILLSGNEPWVNKTMIKELTKCCSRQMLNIPGRTLRILPVSLKQHAVSIGSGLAAIEADLCRDIWLPLNQVPLVSEMINQKEIVSMQ